ncbi:nuclease-related domain-containing protein [Bhargavaea ullalensis]|uniref:NERD domain-containing protein n=1 Tax=Bhargavaea ullalensis TaxID=1265685 RepID=A0ABV2G8M0_9BACL
MTPISEVMEFALEELVMRLAKSDEKREDVIKQLKNHRAGKAGEERVMDVVRSVRLPEECEVLVDLNLPLASGWKFQIDIMIVMPSGLLVLESKQIGGRLRFSSWPATLNKLDDEGRITLTMDCPVAQLEDQKGNLTQLLDRQGLLVPINGAVVFANHPIIEQIPPNVPVIKLRELRRMLRYWLSQERTTSAGQIQEIARFLRGLHKPYLAFPLRQRFNMTSESIYLKPMCKTCEVPLDKPSERTWICPKCRKPDPEANIRTLLIYFLLGHCTITVNQCMELLSIKSRTYARSLIGLFAVRKIGKGRATVYELDYERQFFQEAWKIGVFLGKGQNKVLEMTSKNDVAP